MQIFRIRLAATSRLYAFFAMCRSLPQLAVAVLAALLMPAAAHGGVAITGGTLYTLEDDQPRENMTVLIDDGVVQAVGRDLSIPEGYERVDAVGKVVTPGLIESMSQLGLVEISGEGTTVDGRVRTINMGSDVPAERFRSGPGFDIQYAINADSTLLPVNRMEGVTRAIIAPEPGNDPLSGWGAAIRLGGSDVLTHPRLALFGAVGAYSAGFVGGSRSALIQRLRMALEEAAEFRPARYRSEHGDYTRQDMAALRNFLRAGVPLVLTVHRANEIRQVLALAQEHELRLIIHGGAEAWKEAQALAAADVPVIVDVLDNRPVSFDQLGARLDNAVILHDAGVPVMFTAENSHNARLLRQVAGNAVAEGMPWSAVLAGITRLPAQRFNLGAGTGTITRGAPADLVIWNGDPLELTTWAERVMIDGAWQPLESRQTRLLQRYRTLEGDEPYGYR
jgi:imidazolonepropionase-like amidohydrolase